MIKIYKSFTFYFVVISLLIILINLIGYDDKNILLIGLNPILAISVYIANFKGLLLESVPNFHIYILHLITFIIYGVIIDTLFYGIKYIIKNIKLINKNQEDKYY